MLLRKCLVEKKFLISFVSTIVLACAAAPGCGTDGQQRKSEGVSPSAAEEESVEKQPEPEPKVNVEQVAAVLTEYYRGKMLALPEKIANEFEYAEQISIEMARIDPGGLLAAKELGDRFRGLGISADQLRAVAGDPSFEKSLTETMDRAHESDLAPVFANLGAKKLPSMTESQEGCRKLAKQFEKLQDECIGMAYLGLLMASLASCDMDMEELPRIEPAQYLQQCADKGALWAIAAQSSLKNKNP